MHYAADTTPSTPFATLVQAGGLTEADTTALGALPWRRSLIPIGETPHLSHPIALVAAGWAARCRLLPDGQRQFVSLRLPGDFCTFEFLGRGKAKSTLLALTPLTVLQLPLADLVPLLDERPAIMHAFMACSGIDQAIAEEHIVSLGSRAARERMAHFLCEMSCRTARVGNGGEDRIPLPMTQPELGEYIALSSVHVNRTLQALRADGLIASASGYLRILDEPGLIKTASFVPGYLRLDAYREHRAQGQICHPDIHSQPMVAAPV